MLCSELQLRPSRKPYQHRRRSNKDPVTEELLKFFGYASSDQTDWCLEINEYLRTWKSTDWPSKRPVHILLKESVLLLYPEPIRDSTFRKRKRKQSRSVHVGIISTKFLLLRRWGCWISWQHCIFCSLGSAHLVVCSNHTLPMFQKKWKNECNCCGYNSCWKTWLTRMLLPFLKGSLKIAWGLQGKHKPKMHVFLQTSIKFWETKLQELDRTRESLHCPFQELGLCLSHRSSTWEVGWDQSQGMAVSANLDQNLHIKRAFQENCITEGKRRYVLWTDSLTLALLLRSVPEPPTLLDQ